MWRSRRNETQTNNNNNNNNNNSNDDDDDIQDAATHVHENSGNIFSPATLAVQLVKRRSTLRRLSLQRRRSRSSSTTTPSVSRHPDLNLVAQEIETVMFGGNDVDDSEDDDGRHHDTSFVVGENDDDGRDRWRETTTTGRINNDSGEDFLRPSRRSDGGSSRRRRPFLRHAFAASRQQGAVVHSRNNQPTSDHHVRTWRTGEERAEDINSYTLFENMVPFDGESRTSAYSSSSTVHRHHHQQHQPRLQQQQQQHHFRSRKGPSIIYAEKYRLVGSPSLFLPIMVFLASIFVLLLFIRILMGLLTAAIGILVLCLFLLQVLHEFWTRPIRFIKTLHSSPILFLASMGAILGPMDALWRKQLLPVLVNNHRPFIALQMVSDTVVPSSWIERIVLLFVTATSDDSAGFVDRTYSESGTILRENGVQHHHGGGNHIDIVLLSGLVSGLIYGTALGIIWLVLLGDTSQSSILTAYLYRRIWRPLRRQYRRMASSRQQYQQEQYFPHGRSLVCGHNTSEDGGSEHRNNVPHESGNNNDTSTSQSEGEDSRRCVICLERFGDHGHDTQMQDREGQQEETISSIPQSMMGITSAMTSPSPPSCTDDRYQLLPCLHSFHRDCARNWLTVRQSCPICRVKVEGMQGCTIGCRVDTPEYE